MIVQCPTCNRVRIDPSNESIREVVDNDHVVEAWALPIEWHGVTPGVKMEKCPRCAGGKGTGGKTCLD